MQVLAPTTWSCGRRGCYVPGSSSQDLPLSPSRPSPCPPPLPPPLPAPIHPSSRLYRLRRALHGSSTHLGGTPTHRYMSISTSTTSPLFLCLHVPAIYTYILHLHLQISITSALLPIPARRSQPPSVLERTGREGVYSLKWHWWWWWWWWSVMNNQCVPSWDLEETVGIGLNPVSAGAQRGVSGAGGLTAPVAVPMSDQYDEVAELTWEKGNIFWQGLLNRPAPKYPPAPASQMHAIGVGGGGGGDHRETLEAVVGEAAARLSSHLAQPVVPAAPWLGVGVAAVAVARAPADGLVPCGRGDEAAEGEARRKRARLLGEDGRVCASQGSAAPGHGESTLLTLEACGTGADDVCGFTTTTNNSTSLDREDHGSPETENTSFGGGASDSRCFSRRSQRDGLCDEGENVVIKGEVATRSSLSTKRSRAAAIHNESERKRRDRINQKMQTLQKLVPNSSKTDKASMLDEVIDHLKRLQAQVQMMSRMRSMMIPMAVPQLQMSVMANMAQIAQMAQMGLGMMNMAAQPAYPGLAPPMMHPATPFVPVHPPWDAAADRQKLPAATAAAPDAYSAFLACQAAQQNAQQQQQPSSMEAYNRMVAMYQKLSQQHSQPGNSKQ